MFDIWEFLLQTLTLSGVAVLLLVVKAVFKDKLPPKWQFAVWGILGLTALIPAGLFGRYPLFNWQVLIQLVKPLFGEYGYTRVLFPFPVLRSLPRSLPQWLFFLYTMGVVAHILIYSLSYLRLKLALRSGRKPDKETLSRIEAVAAAQGIRLCPVLEVEDLPCAFVCGIFRPVLVIPSDKQTDEKVILHELFHLKNRDTLWSAVICLLRCLHWCNPLLCYCADRALNDLESRCDQNVLEQLEGEQRREYGHILLSMANEKFSRTPGSTGIHNGGKKIAQRIENIARFKKYPQGMHLVSICVILVLVAGTTVGGQAAEFYETGNNVALSLAVARSTPCTTVAGAFDTYAKALLDRNGYYRAMCAPDEMQAQLLTQMSEKRAQGKYPLWEPELENQVNVQSGYYIYNLTQINRNTWQGLLVMEMLCPSDGSPEENRMYLAIQNVQVYKENSRYVAVALDEFQQVQTYKYNLSIGCQELPATVYAGEAASVRAEIKVQTVHFIDSTTTKTSTFFGTTSHFDRTPKPNGNFTSTYEFHWAQMIYLGSEEEKGSITQLGISAAPVYAGEEPPASLDAPNTTALSSHGSSNTGWFCANQHLRGDWDTIVDFNGGGSSIEPNEQFLLPQYYAADLYINGKKAAELVLTKGEAYDRP